MWENFLKVLGSVFFKLFEKLIAFFYEILHFKSSTIFIEFTNKSCIVFHTRKFVFFVAW